MIHGISSTKALEANQSGSGSEHCFFPCKFADLRFAEWDTKEICGFAICGLIITNRRICHLRTGQSKKFSDLRLRNDPKNLRIYDFCGLTKKICVPTFDNQSILYAAHLTPLTPGSRSKPRPTCSQYCLHRFLNFYIVFSGHGL